LPRPWIQGFVIEIPHKRGIDTIFEIFPRSIFLAYDLVKERSEPFGILSHFRSDLVVVHPLNYLEGFRAKHLQVIHRFLIYGGGKGCFHPFSPEDCTKTTIT
jgi:hypothetical protein